MGCKGSKHALLRGGGGCGAPEPRRSSGRIPSRRHSLALRPAAAPLGTLSLDRASAAAAAAVAAVGLSFDDAFGAGGDEAMMKAGNDVDGGGTAGKLLGPSRSFGGWCPATPPLVAAAPPKQRQKRAVAAVPTARVAPRTPTKTPARGPPEEINVWELMKGLDDEEGEDKDEEEEVEKEGGEDDQVLCVERKAQSAPGSPVFDPEILDAFRKALDELTPDSPLPDFVKPRGDGGGDAEKREIQMFPGIVRARVSLLQEKINAKTKNLANKEASPAALPPPPESAGRVVVYLTSLRGIRQTYEDCWSTSAVLRGYGVRVDERDLSMHAGFKDELRAALGGDGGDGGRMPLPRLPQVFADGRHLGGAEEVRRLHEAGELAAALEACDAAPPCAGKGGDGALDACCGSCGGVKFVPCDACSGSCKVFVEDDNGDGAFRRCPECNENGLVRCPVC